MDIGELVNVAIPEQEEEGKCPFSHDPPKATEKNELGGIGTTLGDNMTVGEGISHKSKQDGSHRVGDKEPDPRYRSKPLTCILVRVNGEYVKLGNGKILPYPLTCAAHHLIPAQEALKDNPILKFICKEGESQDFRNGGDAAAAAFPGALVWGNVAYNVNGSQNGVWLPGNYAVGAGVGGVEVWKSRVSDKRKTFTDEEAADNWAKKIDTGSDEWASMSIDPEEVERPTSLALALRTASKKEFMLAGTNCHIDEGNPKWGYVKSAMDATSAQFHDRHEPYSNEVASYLKKIAARYQQMYDRAVNPQSPCKDCRKARVPAGAKEHLVGPPYGIVGRLAAASKFFHQYVKTKMVTADNIYTSRWVKAWIDSRAKK